MTQKKEVEPLLSLKYSSDLYALIWIIPLLWLIFWAATNGKTFWLGIGVLLTFSFLNSMYNSYQRRKQFHIWLEEHDNLLILFYPLRKAKQTIIRKNFAHRIDRSIKQMYYHKSKLSGDIKSKIFIKMALNQLNRINPNHPRLIQISGQSLIEMLNLYELNRIEKIEPARIDELIEEINSYA